MNQMFQLLFTSFLAHHLHRPDPEWGWMMGGWETPNQDGKNDCRIIKMMIRFIYIMAGLILGSELLQKLHCFLFCFPRKTKYFSNLLSFSHSPALIFIQFPSLKKS